LERCGQSAAAVMASFGAMVPYAGLLRTHMHGSCLCGEVAFQISGALPKLYQCHCSLCRKQGGSSSNAAFLVRAQNMSWTKGRVLVSTYERPTGFRSHFCSKCGSPVPNPLRTTAYYWVPAGLLDDEPDLQVAVHLFVGSKASWDEIGPDGTRFDTMPGLSELLDLLHAR